MLYNIPDRPPDYKLSYTFSHQTFNMHFWFRDESRCGFPRIGGGFTQNDWIVWYYKFNGKWFADFNSLEASNDVRAPNFVAILEEVWFNKTIEESLHENRRESI